MTLEERVARLEARTDTLDRIERSVDGVRNDVAALEGTLESVVEGLREEFRDYRQENAAVLERILATLQAMQRRPRWPWQS